MNIICKNYEHYNNAMGVYVKNKRDYEEKMKRLGFVDADEGNEIAKKAREKSMKQYGLSEKSQKQISSVKNGFISSRLRDDMAKGKKVDFMGNKGGFR